MYRAVIMALAAIAAVPQAVAQSALVCAGAKIYQSPTAPPISRGVLVASGGKITEVAADTGAQPKLPPSARKLECAGKVVVAGFWNSHVHFETGWESASNAPAAALESRMQAMLTRWGFTTVWDLGSEPNNTLALRRRVEAGEVPGPKILMAGDIFPKGGHPVYLPAELQLPEAATPEQAPQMAQQYMQMGLDGMKLFTGAYMGAKPVINMDTAIVQAASEVAHAQGKPVFAHPQNRVGVDHALAGGVNILAHTIPTEGSFSPSELEQMQRQHTALIPTLTLWTTVTQDASATAQLVQAGVNQLRAYSQQGGVILFGTDVGFIQKFDTAEEFSFMARAMGWKEILASLTTNPSAYFHAANKGQIEAGMDADFVVLEGDPARDVKNLARVKYTVRAGRVIYGE